MFVDRPTPPGAGALLRARSARASPADKVDLLILGDGYTAAERGKFEKRRAAADGDPLRRRALQGARRATSTSGVSARRRRSRDLAAVDRHPPPLAGGRHLRRLRLRALHPHLRQPRLPRRRLAGALRVRRDPDQQQHLRRRRHLRPLSPPSPPTACGRPTSSSTSSATTSPRLADEYYTSDVAYEPAAERAEPWEPNVTALLDPAKLKWRTWSRPARRCRRRGRRRRSRSARARSRRERRKIRAEKRPESEMDALFRAPADDEDEARSAPSRTPARSAPSRAPTTRRRATTGRRSTASCSPATAVPFCAVCQRAIERVIDLYAKGAQPR